MSNWADQSGNSNDVAQATGAQQPPVNASSINSLPALTFSGTKLLSNTRTIITPGADRTVIGVIKNGAATAGGTVFHFRTAPPLMNFAAEQSGIGNFLMYSDASANVSQTAPQIVYDGNAHVLEWYMHVGASPGFVYDGVTKTIEAYSSFGNTVSSDTGGTALNLIGNYPGGIDPFLGDIAEGLIYDHLLTSGDQISLRRYLHGRYAINLGV